MSNETLTGVRIVRGLYVVDVLASVDGGPDRTINIDRAIWNEMAEQIVSVEGGHERNEAFMRGVRDTCERLMGPEAVEVLRQKLAGDLLLVPEHAARAALEAVAAVYAPRTETSGA